MTTFIKVPETDKVYEVDTITALPDFDPDTVISVTVGDKKIKLSDIKITPAVDPNSFDSEIANLNSQIADVNTKAEADKTAIDTKATEDVAALQQHITDTQAKKDEFNAQFGNPEPTPEPAV